MKKNNIFSFIKRYHFFIFLFIFLLQVNSSKGQETKTEPDNTYGKNGKKETTISKDELGKEITTIKYYDGSNPPKLKKESVSFRKLDNSGTETHIIKYDDQGRKEETLDYDVYDNGNSKLEQREYSDYDERVTGGFIRTFIDKISKTYEWDPEKKEFKGWNDGKISYENNKPEEKNLSQSNAGNNNRDCSYKKISLSAGYSFLSGKIGNENSGFPLGGKITGIFDISSHLGVGVTASIHNKKQGYQTLTRSFIMAATEYNFGNTENCDTKILADIHITGGIGFEKVKYSLNNYKSISKGNGFAFGGGVGLGYKITDQWAITLNGNYTGVKYKNQDEINRNIEVDFGVIFRIQRPF
jgi:opacity protein-like surface antigen